MVWATPLEFLETQFIKMFRNFERVKNTCQSMYYEFSIEFRALTLKEPLNENAIKNINYVIMIKVWCTCYHVMQNIN